MMKRQFGFLSVEVLFVLIVVSSGLVLGLNWMSRAADLNANKATAEYTKTVMDAASAWIRDNYSAVEAAASPLAIYSIADIASKLPSNFGATNPYGQTYSIRVYKPAANKLETAIIGTGGETIDDRNLREIAQLIGAAGGYVSAADTMRATGTFGGWSMPLSFYGGTPGAGKVVGAVFFSDGAVVNDYLYRNSVAGHPEFNTMNTAINMGNNSITDAAAVNARTIDASASITAGANLSATGNVTAGATVSGTDLAASNSISAGGDVLASGTVTGTALVGNTEAIVYGPTLTSADNWAFLGYGSSWNPVSAPQNAVGSAYLNDAYFRSIGKWASQMNGITLGPAQWFHTGDGGQCPDGWIMQGTSGWWATYTDVWNLCRPIW